MCQKSIFRQYKLLPLDQQLVLPVLCPFIKINCNLKFAFCPFTKRGLSFLRKILMCLQLFGWGFGQ